MLKPVKMKTPTKKPVEDEEDESSSEDSDQELMIKDKKLTAIKSKVTKKTQPVNNDDDDESDDDDDDESDEFDEDEDESDDDDQDLTEADVLKELAKLKAQSLKLSKDDDDEDDDSEDDDSEEDDDEEETATMVKNNKRKMPTPEIVSPKKPKQDEIVSIFLGGLNRNSTSDGIKECFKEQGIILTDVRKKPNKRFGHCDLAKAKDLKKALKLDGMELDGIKINVGTATAARPDLSLPEKLKLKKVGKKTLVVKNLKFSVTEDDLLDMFKNTGGIAARIPVFTHNGQSRGKGFVDFDNLDNAHNAAKTFNETKLKGRKIYIEFAPEAMKPGVIGSNTEKKRKPKVKKREFKENKFEDDSE